MRSPCVVLVIACLARGASADCTTEQEKGEAFELFKEGRALMSDGKPELACAKFELSLRKDPRAVGTLLNLGLCNEQRGKLATALRLYQEALDRSVEAGLAEQQQAAKDKVMALSPQVAIAKLVFGAAPAPRAKLVIDNAVVALDVGELPLDAGRHEIVLSAPGRLPYQASFEIGAAERRDVVLPALHEPETQIVDRTGPRLYGKLALYSGAGLVLSASGLAGWAWHRYDAQFPTNCMHPAGGGAPLCNEAGRSATERARSYGTIATVVGGVGVAAVIAGAIIVWRSPAAEHRTVIVPTASAAGAGAAVVGSF